MQKLAYHVLQDQLKIMMSDQFPDVNDKKTIDKRVRVSSKTEIQ